MSKKYSVIVTADTTVSCIVTVEAGSVEEAMDLACHKAIDEGAAWERDDTELSPYTFSDAVEEIT